MEVAFNRDEIKQAGGLHALMSQVALDEEQQEDARARMAAEEAYAKWHRTNAKAQRKPGESDMQWAQRLSQYDHGKIRHLHPALAHLNHAIDGKLTETPTEDHLKFARHYVQHAVAEHEDKRKLVQDHSHETCEFHTMRKCSA